MTEQETELIITSTICKFAVCCKTLYSTNASAQHLIEALREYKWIINIVFIVRLHNGKIKTRPAMFVFDILQPGWSKQRTTLFMDCGSESVLPHEAKGTEERSRESQMEEFSWWPKGADTGLVTTAWEQINEHGGINRCRLLRCFLCFFPQTWRLLPARLTHARAQIVVKKKVDPFWEVRSHLVCWVEGSICIIVNVWHRRKCKKICMQMDSTSRAHASKPCNQSRQKSNICPHYFLCRHIKKW